MGMLHREAYRACYTGRHTGLYLPGTIGGIPTRYHRRDTYQGVYTRLSHQGVYTRLSHQGILGYTTTRVYWAIPPPWVHLSSSCSGTRHPACWPCGRFTALAQRVAELTVGQEAVTVAVCYRHPFHCWSKSAPCCEESPPWAHSRAMRRRVLNSDGPVDHGEGVHNGAQC